MILRMLMGATGQGLLWALLAIGVFITFRILEFADLTCEGSFALGGAVTSIVLYDGGSIVVSLLLALAAGAIAGMVTGLLHTKLKIPAILSGILTMIALYSINIRIMDEKPTLSLLNIDTIIQKTGALFGVNSAMSSLITGLLFVGIMTALLYMVFGTEKGSAIRATGANEKMCRALGISTDNTKIAALMLSNAIIALSGALVAQNQATGDVNMGMGAIVIGLASVIIGEAFTSQKFPFWLKLLFIALGSIIYRIIVAFVIYVEFFKPYDLKLFTAVVVVVALSLPHIKKMLKKPAPAVADDCPNGNTDDSAPEVQK